MRTSVNKGKKKIKKYINNNTAMQRRQGRRNLLADEFLVKVKDVVTGLLIAGGVIYRKLFRVIQCYQGKFSMKDEGLWRSHCTERRLCKECIETNGVD